MFDPRPHDETFDLESRSWDEFGRNAVPSNEPAESNVPGDTTIRTPRCESSRREILNHSFGTPDGTAS